MVDVNPGKSIESNQINNTFYTSKLITTYCLCHIIYDMKKITILHSTTQIPQKGKFFNTKQVFRNSKVLTNLLQSSFHKLYPFFSTIVFFLLWVLFLVNGSKMTLLFTLVKSSIILEDLGKFSPQNEKQ